MRKFTRALICSALVLASASLFAQARYNVRLLDTPTGTGNTYPEAINENGEVAGSGTTAGSDRAMKWSGATTPAVTQLTSLNNVGISRAYGINNSGAVCGADQLVVAGGYEPIIWSAGGTPTSILPTGATYGFAYGMNTAGKVTGLAYTSGYTNKFTFLYNGSTSVNIIPGGGYNTDTAIAINDADQILASSYTDSTMSLYQGGARTAIYSYGWWTAPASLALSSLGQVVFMECSGTSSGYDTLGLWNPKGRNVTDGYTQSITPTGFDSSLGAGVNSFGDIVASATVSGNAHAFVRIHGSSASWEDLNTLIPSGTGWVLSYARAVNDKGQIIGRGLYTVGGVTRSVGFRLDPISYVNR